jgi:hypothetical protein
MTTQRRLVLAGVGIWLTLGVLVYRGCSPPETVVAPIEFPQYDDSHKGELKQPQFWKV